MNPIFCVALRSYPYKIINTGISNFGKLNSNEMKGSQDIFFVLTIWG